MRPHCHTRTQQWVTQLPPSLHVEQTIPPTHRLALCVAAHAKGRTRSKAQAGGLKAKQAIKDTSPLPDWVTDLQAAGFDAFVRDGELFVQRGDTAASTSAKETPVSLRGSKDNLRSSIRQLSSSPNNTSSNSSANSPAGVKLKPSSTVQPGANIAASQATIASKQATTEQLMESFTINHARCDFQGWPPVPGAALQTANSGRASAVQSSKSGRVESSKRVKSAAMPPQGAVAWYELDSSTHLKDSSAAAQGAADSTPRLHAANTSSASIKQNNQEHPAISGEAAAETVASLLHNGFQHPDELLEYVSSAFPRWKANSYRLVHMAHSHAVPAPSPYEAATAIRGAALAAKTANFGANQRSNLVSLQNSV